MYTPPPTDTHTPKQFQVIFNYIGNFKSQKTCLKAKIFHPQEKRNQESKFKDGTHGLLSSLLYFKGRYQFGRLCSKQCRNEWLEDFVGLMPVAPALGSWGRPILSGRAVSSTQWSPVLKRKVNLWEQGAMPRAGRAHIWKSGYTLCRGLDFFF